MEKIKIEECPYCKSENIKHIGRLRWICCDCNLEFNKDEYLHQLYWENISCLLNETSEEEPLNIDYCILPSVEKESCGLSDSEKLGIDKVFQVEGDGTMWYHFEGCDNFPHGFDGERVPIWEDMYELSTEDLKYLLDYIREVRRKEE